MKWVFEETCHGGLREGVSVHRSGKRLGKGKGLKCMQQPIDQDKTRAPTLIRLGLACSPVRGFGGWWRLRKGERTCRAVVHIRPQSGGSHQTDRTRQGNCVGACCWNLEAV